MHTPGAAAGGAAAGAAVAAADALQVFGRQAQDQKFSVPPALRRRQFTRKVECASGNIMGAFVYRELYSCIGLRGPSNINCILVKHSKPQKYSTLSVMGQAPIQRKSKLFCVMEPESQPHMIVSRICMYVQSSSFSA